MRLFIQNTLAFILLILIFFLMNGLINYYIYANDKVELKNTRILITGDSQTQNGLDPSLFKSAQNISQSGEPYVFSYWKLIKVLESYQPDTIIIGFGPHNFSKYHDFKLSDEVFSDMLFRRNYPIEQLQQLDARIDVNYTSFYKTLWKQTAFYPKLKHGNYIGEYKNASAGSVLKWEHVIKKHYYQDDHEVGTSEVAISYLDSIVQLCQQEKITLVLAGIPIHKNYYDRIPSKMLSKYTSIKKKYNERAIIIDHLSLQYPDSCYSNASHLSRYGANLYTPMLIKILKNNGTDQ